MNFLKIVSLCLIISTPIFSADYAQLSKKNAGQILRVQDIEDECLQERLREARRNKRGLVFDAIAKKQDEHMAAKALILTVVGGTFLSAVVIKNLFGF